METIHLFLHGWVAAQCSSTLFEDNFLSFSPNEQQLFRKWKDHATFWEDVQWLPIFKNLIQNIQDEQELLYVYNMIIDIALTFTTYSYNYAAQFKDLLDFLHREKYVNPAESYPRIISAVHAISDDITHINHNNVQILGFIIDCWVNHTNETSTIDELCDWNSVHAKCTHSGNIEELKYHSNYLREHFQANESVWLDLWTKFTTGDVLDDDDLSSIWDQWYEWIETGNGPMSSIFEEKPLEEIVSPFVKPRTAYVHMINQNEMSEALSILMDSCESSRVSTLVKILEIVSNSL